LAAGIVGVCGLTNIVTLVCKNVSIAAIMVNTILFFANKSNHKKLVFTLSNVKISACILKSHPTEVYKKLYNHSVGTAL
jgi:hypothetical protein